MTGKIILARNMHSGIEQAERLEGLIKEANMVSFETAFLPEDQVNYLEGLFVHKNQGRLQEALDLFQRKLQKKYDGNMEHEKRLCELLRQHHREVVMIERHNDANIAARQWKRETGGRIKDLYLQGELDAALALQMQDLKELKEDSSLRNRTIVEFAPEALRRAKRKAGRQNITYLVILGNLHAIAQDLADRTNVVVEDVLVPGSPYSNLLVINEMRRLFFAGKNEEAQQIAPLHFLERSLQEIFYEQPEIGTAMYKVIMQEERMRQTHASLDEVVKNYIVEPLSSNIARQVSPEQARAYLARLGKSLFEEVSRGDYQRWSSITFDFLREVGIAVPEEGKGDIEKWKALFPFGKEGSQEIVRTLHYPRAKV